MDFDVNVAVLKIAEKVRALATQQGRVPFKSGDLRKSIYTQLIGKGRAVVGSNLSYARAVHDGRRALVISPNLNRNPPLGMRVIRGSKAQYASRARLKFKVGGLFVFARQVSQRARKARPFILEAFKDFVKDKAWIERNISKDYADYIIKKIQGGVR